MYFLIPTFISAVKPLLPYSKREFYCLKLLKLTLLALSEFAVIEGETIYAKRVFNCCQTMWWHVNVIPAHSLLKLMNILSGIKKV